MADLKTCKRCGEIKEDIPENFRPRKGRKSSEIYCRECERARAREYGRKNKDKIVEKNRKWREENREKSREYMKNYMKDYLPEYREENREMLNEKQREYRKDNEKVKQNQQRYYQENKERIDKRNKEWRENNRAKMSEACKRWWKDNKAKRREYSQTRRAKLKELPADLTVEQWEYIQNYFNHCCAYCGEKKELHQDHFIPVNSEGGYTITNIIPACQQCNSSKHDNSFFKWYPNYKHYSQEREEKILNFLFDVKVLQ